MFALGIEFITGVAVMTDASSRERAEWPPHPARVFMALVAAHCEFRPLPEDGPEAAESWKRERAALEWLEEQDAPEMCWPHANPRTSVKVYVPVNDVGVPQKPEKVREDDLRDALGVIPEYRSRQERTFPAVRLEGENADQCVYLAWPNATPSSEIVDAIRVVAGKVTRIGHSSSLVRVWVAGQEALARLSYKPGFKVAQRERGFQLRIPARGILGDLDQCYNADDIEAFFALVERISMTKGKAQKVAKEEFAKRFGREWNRALHPPIRKRPSVGITALYGPMSESRLPAASTMFDPDLLIMTKMEGPVLGLESTAILTAALRGLLLQGSENKPSWFTGHSEPGVPSTGGHMALLPLAFVGSEHADGHILGLALAFPRSVSAQERAECLRGILFDRLGEDLELNLTMGRIGNWTLRREERSAPPLALRAWTWTRPSDVWASVTPVVLDRHPKHDRRSEHAEWREEVVASIAASCERQGLPKPTWIDVDKTSWHRGAPRSRPGSGGMPLLPVKEGGAPRQQVHVLIQFPCEIEGPLMLGAGRFRGYGFFKPLGSL